MRKLLLPCMLCLFHFWGGAQIITTIAGIGSGPFSGDGGPATSARLAAPSGVAIDKKGNIFIADANNYRIRKIAPNGIITTIAGTNSPVYNGDSIPAVMANIDVPRGISLDSIGNLYVADYYGNRIRKIDTSGMISTVAGNGYSGYEGDGGAATEARIHYPTDVHIAPNGDILIADTYNNRIRRVDAGGIITTIAGNGTSETDYGFSGDGGPATAARLHFPCGVVADKQGNVFFSDQHNHRIRKIDPSGIITTIAGNGNGGYGSNGSVGTDGDNIPAIQAKLYFPTDITIDSAGNLIVADYQNNRVRKINPNGIITTVAGQGYFGFGGDGGPALKADVNIPAGVAVLGRDTILIADCGNHRVRKTPSQPVRLCIGGTATLVSNVGGSFFQWQQNPGTGVFSSINDNANFTGTTTNTLTLNNIPASWSGYEFRCRANGSTNSRLFPIGFSNTWVGTVNNNWENPANWSCGSVPQANTDVFINSGTVVINSNTTIKSFIVKPGVTVTVKPGVQFIVLN